LKISQAASSPPLFANEFYSHYLGGLKSNGVQGKWRWGMGPQPDGFGADCLPVVFGGWGTSIRTDSIGAKRAIDTEQARDCICHSSAKSIERPGSLCPPIGIAGHHG
jgi:hypothetical protein